MAEAAQPHDSKPGANEEAVTVQDALEYAVQSHRIGREKIAEALYERILQAVPDYAPALHYYGILHHQTGRSEKAVELIRRAIVLEADDPGMHNNLGNVLSELNRPAEAVEAYRAAIRLTPGHSDARANLGVALRALGRLDEAEAAYLDAIKADPRHREAHDNLGRLLSARGRVTEAIAFHAKAIELEPRNADSRRLLAAAYSATGELEKATAILRDWLEDEPSSPTARHLLAAVTGEDVPSRADDIYVETTFDKFADSFDEKLEKLEYRAPALVGDAVGRACGEPHGDLEVLDAGCGTGLCGPYLKPYASRLIGIDLSSKMLRSAARRGGYDDLVHVELTEFLLGTPVRYDLIVSADTLCYFGALDEVIQAASGALRPGGFLAFTVEEETEVDEFRLNPHGRYSHSRQHVSRTLAEAGLIAPEIVSAHLRTERGEPVAGLVVTARKPASVADAISYHAEAVELDPRNTAARRHLVAAYVAAGELEKATPLLRSWLKEEPDSLTARHLLAAVSGEGVPARADEAFVETIFDHEAASFDAKLERLRYRAPALLSEAVAKHLGEPRADLLVLDAGCGTGLCAPHLRPYASRLTGVDLSSKMLERARRRGGYDDLARGEMTAFLAGRPAAFDLIVSADTLCYFGSLDEVLREACKALRPGGVLAFTVEEERGAGAFRLNPHGRFSHSREHVARALDEAGLIAPEIAAGDLRTEQGEPVAGLVVTARKPSE